MKTIAECVGVVAVLMSCAFAEAPDEVSPEKAAILANGRAYEIAYANSDLPALVNFFTDDAEYTTDEGRTFSGRAEIEAAIRAGTGCEPRIQARDQCRYRACPRPESLLEKGSTTVTGTDGESSGSLYTAMYLKKDGGGRSINLSNHPCLRLRRATTLKSSRWLVGNWQETDQTDLSIQSEYAWARGGNFLTRNVTVKRAGTVTLEGWQIIGWDPIEERLRSWTFDDAGGYAEGYFTREGNRWLQREIGVTPDGGRTGADNTITKISADRFTWESNNRTLDGDPQPSIG